VVHRKDGGIETVEIKGLDGDGQSISVEMTVRKEGSLMASEKTKPNDSRD
jgi:hypothetical protein